jgi:hypothetical protein
VATGLVSPLYLTDRSVDEALRDGVALPSTMARTLARGVSAVIDRAAPTEAPDPRAPQPIVPGSLSAFTAQEHP